MAQATYNAAGHHLEDGGTLAHSWSSVFQLKKRRYLLMGATLVVDVVLLAGVLVAANALYLGWPMPAENMRIYAQFWPAYLLFKLAVFFVFGLYNENAFQFRSTTLLAIVEATLAAAVIEFVVVATVMIYMDPDAYKFSRGALLTKAGLEIGALTVWRLSLIRLNLRRGIMAWRSLVVGATKEGRDLILRNTNTRFRTLVGYVDEQPAADLKGCGVPYLGTMEEVSRILGEKGVNELIVTAELNPAYRFLNAVTSHSTSIKVYPRSLENMSTKATTCEINDVPLIEVNGSNLSLSTMILKRLVDIAAAAGGLLVCLPALAALWVVYRLLYGGGMIYSQERIGRGGRLFTIYKIRTMVKDAEAHQQALMCHGRDPRVLPLGWVLRRTHFDEVVQLWNVLRGDMSLVGPRPERPERAAAFIEQNPAYNLRHIVKPGLTGLAQVKGKYDTDFEYKLFYDLVYAFNLSVLFDLKILYQTPKYIFAELFGEKNQY